MTRSPAQPSIASELRTLFWLQWRLTLATFRSTRVSDRMRVLRYLLLAFQVLFTGPFSLLIGAGIAAVMIFLLSPRAAVEAAMALNTFLLFMWLLLPASHNSQLVERFDMSRLFHHPISYRGIVVGSTLISMLTMTGLWTVPLLLGQVVGLAYHSPLAFPLVLFGALPVFALLLLSGRVIEDLFDLVASDRRLRALLLFVLGLPFVLLWLSQYLVQIAPHLIDELPGFIVPLLESLEQAESLSEAVEAVAPSRILLWLPPGWATATMGFPVMGAWGRWPAFLGLSLAFTLGLLLVHARVTRRLMDGAALTIGPQRVRRRLSHRSLPGPPALWGLLQKDWIYLWRSPMPRRIFLSGLLIVALMALSLMQIPDVGVQPDAGRLIKGLLTGGSVLLLTFMTSLGVLGNYFGTIDREGLGSLARSGVDRRYILASATLISSLPLLVQQALILSAISYLVGDWRLLPLGLYLGLCLQLGGAPAYLFASLIGPYRTQLSFTSGTRQQGNLWGFIAFALASPLPLLLIGLPYLFWPPGLILTLPLAGLLSGGIFILLLEPLGRFMLRKEYEILKAVTGDT